jgi:nucleotide-binding universal stress UspA family protein
VKLFSHILCATDFSPNAERGVAIAAKLASDLNAVLTLIHVDHSLWMTMGNLAPLPDLRTEGREHIEEELRQLRARHAVPRAQIEVAEGKPHEVIAERVSTSGADLLVLGSHGASGRERRHLGSVTEKVLRRVEVPMLVVPPDAEPTAEGSRKRSSGHSRQGLSFERLLLAVDLGAMNEAAATDTVELARLYHSKVLALHVAAPLDALFPGSGGFWSGPESAELEARLEQVRTRAMSRILPAAAADEEVVEAELRIREGVPYELIGSTARDEKIDLVILGPRGSGAEEPGWIGSTTHEVIRRGTCPTLVVR